MEQVFSPTGLQSGLRFEGGLGARVPLSGPVIPSGYGRRHRLGWSDQDHQLGHWASVGLFHSTGPQLCRTVVARQLGTLFTCPRALGAPSTF